MRQKLSKLFVYFLALSTSALALYFAFIKQGGI